MVNGIVVEIDYHTVEDTLIVVVVVVVEDRNLMMDKLKVKQSFQYS
jgi:hypothetical protein